jgi:predicted amidohydrolase
MIIDPWGKVLAELGGEGPGIAIADIDLATVDEARGKVPALANARPFSLSVAEPGGTVIAREDETA